MRRCYKPLVLLAPLSTCHCSSQNGGTPNRLYGGSGDPKLVIFAGGTAMNSIAAELKELSTSTAHVIPVSDDGGSTAEILRVLGGPAMGDLRSRAIRLADESTAESSAVKRLLGHRLGKVRVGWVGYRA